MHPLPMFGWCRFWCLCSIVVVVVGGGGGGGGGAGAGGGGGGCGCVGGALVLVLVLVYSRCVPVLGLSLVRISSWLAEVNFGVVSLLRPSRE